MNLLFQIGLSQPVRPAPIRNGNAWESIAAAGRQVRAIAADPDEPGRIYAGGEGIARSDNRGLTWETVNSALNPTFLVVDPSDSATLYAIADGSLWRSRDSGWTWSPTAQPPQFTGRLVVDAGGALYASQPTSFARSTDRGDTWRMTTLPDPGTDVTPIGADPHVPGSIYVFVRSGLEGLVFRTSESGRSWFGPLLSSQHLEDVGDLAFDAAPSSVVYLVLNFGGLFPHGAVFATEDAGETWQALFGALVLRSIVSDPVRPRTVYVSASSYGSFSVFRWTPGRVSVVGFPTFDARRLAVAADGSALYAIDSAGSFAVLRLGPSVPTTRALRPR